MSCCQCTTDSIFWGAQYSTNGAAFARREFPSNRCPSCCNQWFCMDLPSWVL